MTFNEAASTDPRTAKEWGGVYVHIADQDTLYAREGRILSNRALHVLFNDPHIAALAQCLRLQVLGTGLWLRSTNTDEKTRKQIDRSIVYSSPGSIRDAGHTLTRLELERQILIGGHFQGNAWAIRSWKPKRPQNGGWATCWRVIDPSRVATPPDNTDQQVINGVRYDDNGDQLGIYVRRWSAPPIIGVQPTSPTYDYFPIFDRSGERLVVQYAPERVRAGCSMGNPSISAGLLMIHQLQKLFSAHVSGKRIQASHPIIMPVANPKAASEEHARRVNAGEISDSASILFVSENSGIPQFSQIKYEGSDLANLVETYVRAIAAAIGYPWQVVLCQLSNSNLAASQAALDQAERTSTAYQDGFIEQALGYIDRSYVREAWANGWFGDVPWSRALWEASYQRPRRADANRLRTRQAALLALQLGISPSRVYDELGEDYETEQAQQAVDRDVAQGHGNPLPGTELSTANVGTADGDNDNEETPSTEDDEENTDATPTSGDDSVSLNRDEFGRIVSVTKAGKTFAVARDSDGNIHKLELDSGT